MGTVLTWLCCMVSWFPVGLWYYGTTMPKRLQRQWIPGRVVPCHKSCVCSCHLPAQRFYEIPRFAGHLLRVEAEKREREGEGSGDWICVYLQRICAVAGKWTYNLTCLTNAFKRFSSYFPQNRDQSCRLFSSAPPFFSFLLLFIAVVVVAFFFLHSLFRIPFQLALHFPFAFRFTSPFNSVFWFNLQFDCNRYQRSGCKKVLLVAWPMRESKRERERLGFFWYSRRHSDTTVNCQLGTGSG